MDAAVVEPIGVTTVGQALAGSTVRLREAGIADARFEARLLLVAATGLSRETMLAEPGRELTAAQRAALEELTARRARREPMAYVLGRREFWSLDLGVGPGLHVPRPETVTVVEAVLDAGPDRGAPLRLLDLGTGSGCLLLALLAELPNATGIGVDISPAAVDAATANAVALGLEGRAGFRRGDWGEGLAGLYDVVVSNPPYIPRQEIEGLAAEVRDFEPRAALDGGADGLDAYRRLAAGVPRLLAPGGRPASWAGGGASGGAAPLRGGAGLPRLVTRRDLAGIDRCVVVRRAA